MFWKLIGVLLVTAARSAQGDGGGDAVPTALRTKTLMEEILDSMKLDSKTQLPAVQEIFQVAQRDSVPVMNQMMQSRQRMVNADIAASSAQVQAEIDTYTVAAAKMATIEAQAFSKIYALLKPNQQAKAQQAFALMAGLYMPTSPAAPARGGGR